MANETTVNTNQPVVGKPEISDTGMDKTVMIASSIGALAGLGYAFYTKKKFWGYVGFFFLGSIAGSLVGNVIKKK